jgi:hypothetical protein
MAGQHHPTQTPIPTPTRNTNIAEFAARTFGYRASSCPGLWQCSAARLDFCNAGRTFFGARSPSTQRATRVGATPYVRWFHGAQVSYSAHLFAGCRADAVAIIDVQEASGSQQQSRYRTRAQERTAAQALNPRAKSPRKISTTITSPRGTS